MISPGCSLCDWAKFVADQLCGAQGKKSLLPAALYRTLHTPLSPEEQYTPGGWGYGKGKHGPRLAHDGSNTLNHASAVLFPKADLAVLVVCNQGGKAAQQACAAVRKALLERLLP